MASPSLLKGIGTVGFFTLGSRITGFVRDMLQAALLGAGDAAAAFIIAFRLPNLFRSLFAEGAFSAGFVPLFTAMHESEGHAKAMAFAREAAGVLALALAAFSALMIVFMPAVVFVIAPGFADYTALMDEAKAMAARIAAHPVHAIRASKKLVRDSQHVSLPVSLDMASAYQALVQTTYDHREAIYGRQPVQRLVWLLYRDDKGAFIHNARRGYCIDGDFFTRAA